MRNAKTGRLILAIAGSLACHLLAFVALRSERPIVVPHAPAIEVSLMREPEAFRPVEPRTPEKTPTQHRPDAASPPQAPLNTPNPAVEPISAPPVEARTEPPAPAAPSAPAVPGPPKLAFDCDDLTLKSVARQRCPTKRLARGPGRPGGEQVAFARQAEFDAEKAQKNGGPIVIGHLTLRPAPDANSDPNLIGIFKFSF